MTNSEPTSIERMVPQRPTLLKGLAEAAKNGFEYGIDSLKYPFNPDENAEPPVKRKNTIFGEWLGQFKDI